jgi:hypothetical protein
MGGNINIGNSGSYISNASGGLNNSMTPNLRYDKNISKASEKGYVAYSKRNISKKNSS